MGIEPTTVAVPSVSGQDATTAQKTLSDQGFKVTVSNVDGTGQAGSVLGTSPAAGTQVAKGSDVTLQLSNGNQGGQVPNVVGQDENDARQALEDAGFTNIRTQDVDTGGSQSDGTVISTNPTAGQTADADEQITLFISNSSGDSGGFFGGGGGGGGNN